MSTLLDMTSGAHRAPADAFTALFGPGRGSGSLAVARPVNVDLHLLVGILDEAALREYVRGRDGVDASRSALADCVMRAGLSRQAPGVSIRYRFDGDTACAPDGTPAIRFSVSLTISDLPALVRYAADSHRKIWGNDWESFYAGKDERAVWEALIGANEMPCPDEVGIEWLSLPYGEEDVTFA